MAINNFGSQTEPGENNESQVEKKLKKSSPINMILLFVLLGVIFYGGFLSFDKGNILNKTLELETQAKDLQVQIDTIKENKVEVSQNASGALKKIEADEVRWSEVIAEVNKLLPQDALGKRNINVLSYSGSGDGRIAVNLVTKPESLPPFNDVAQLIATFNNSVFFKDVYVPAISKGSSDSGDTMLSFVLNMDYQKQETGSDALILNQPVPSVKVPRNN